MKLLALFILLSVVSCNDPVRHRFNDPLPKTSPLTQQNEQTQRTQDSDQGIYASRSMTHMAPAVKIDTERQEIVITGHSGQSCGIDFLDGKILRYQLLNDNELELLMEAETLKLTRVHTNELSGVYGDWQSIDFKEETVKNRERIVTFFIRDQEIMNVDVYCEQRYGKLIEDFE
jgi:hypothetical protein